MNPQISQQTNQQNPQTPSIQPMQPMTQPQGITINQKDLETLKGLGLNTGDLGNIDQHLQELTEISPEDVKSLLHASSKFPQAFSETFNAPKTIGNYIDPTNDLPQFQGGDKITQGFGVPVTYEKGGKHTGVDIAIPMNTPIPSNANGEVIGIGSDQKGYGNYVMIKGDDGITRRFAHLSSFNIKQGQQIKKGDVIGLSGSTGNSTGPHLHYEEMK